MIAMGGAKKTRHAADSFWGSGDYCLQKRMKAGPARPTLRSATVPGSGTHLGEQSAPSSEAPATLGWINGDNPEQPPVVGALRTQMLALREISVTGPWQMS